MRQFLAIGSVAFLPGLFYVVWLVRKQRRNALIWLKNDVTIGIFWLSAFPAGAGLLACTLRTDLFSFAHLTSGVALLITFLTILLNLCLIYLYVQEPQLIRRLPPPGRSTNPTTSGPDGSLATNQGTAVALLAENEDRPQGVETTAEESAITTELGVLGQVPPMLRLLLNGAISGLATFLAWYMALLYFNGAGVLSHEWLALAWSVTLAALWVPTTLYARWYCSSFSLSWLARSPFFVLLAAVFLLEAVGLLGMNRTSNGTAAVLGIQSVIPVIIGLLTRLKPEYMRAGSPFSEACAA